VSTAILTAALTGPIATKDDNPNLPTTPEEIAAQADRIEAVAVESRTMPLGNATHMTDDERRLLGEWIRAGAPTR
jgi:uncharacterized membrane protein